MIPGQQVSQVLSGKITETGWFALQQRIDLVQAMVRRVRLHHHLVIAAKAAVENQLALSIADRFCILDSEKAQQRVANVAAGELVGVVLELVEQNRNEVEHATGARVRFQMRRHVAVVLEGVQVGPGEGEITGGVIAIVWLVHMPTEHNR